MSNINFTAGTERSLHMLSANNEQSKRTSLSYRVSMMVDNIKELYKINEDLLTNGTSFSLNQYGFPDVTVEYLAHFGHGNFTVISACAEVDKILHMMKSDMIYANILTECEYKSLMLPKGFQIRLNDLNPAVLNNAGKSYRAPIKEYNYYTATKEYRLNLDSITFYVSIHEDDKVEIWPRVFCTYYEVDIRTDKLFPRYIRSIKIDSIMNYHIPSNLDLEYTIY